jgi:alpha-beta hydrolase superfamily lysophospholipase
MRADTVLNVEDIKRYGPGIGSNVTLVEVTGGMHDLFLSAKAVREQALCVVLAWLAQPSSVQATTAKGQDKSTP